MKSVSEKKSTCELVCVEPQSLQLSEVSQLGRDGMICSRKGKNKYFSVKKQTQFPRFLEHLPTHPQLHINWDQTVFVTILWIHHRTCCCRGRGAPRCSVFLVALGCVLWICKSKQGIQTEFRRKKSSFLECVVTYSHTSW